MDRVTAAPLEFSEDDLIQLSLLRDEETDDLINAGLLGPEHRLSSPLDSRLCFAHEELVLQITAGIQYPVVAPEYEVINLSLSRKDVDRLRGRLREAVAKAATTNNPEKWLDRENSPYGIFEATKVVLEMAKEADNLVNEVRYGNGAGQVQTRAQTQALPWLLKKPVETLSSSEMAIRYLGKTAKEICDTLPAAYRVLHVEEVIRPDLARRFSCFQENLREELLHRTRSLRGFVPQHLHRAPVKDMVEHLVKPRITFHGTQRHFVPSIVRHGFIKPGTSRPGSKEKHEVRCGSTYGMGIYSSPSADFSLSYSDWWGTATKPNEFFGLKLIVCATIMGRTRFVAREDNWRTQMEPYEGADSHVANRLLEYIVFDTAQILPVYVLHLDWGDDNSYHYRDVPLNANDWTPTKTRPKVDPGPNVGLTSQFAGERQRAREAVFAKASKYFPYGFGPATGRRFVVEEVGEVSEDEEDYGDYQALRIEENEDRSASTDFWGWVKAAEEEGDAVGHDIPDEYKKYTGYHPENWDDIQRADQKTERTGDELDDGFHLGRLLGEDGGES